MENVGSIFSTTSLETGWSPFCTITLTRSRILSYLSVVQTNLLESALHLMVMVWWVAHEIYFLLIPDKVPDCQLISLDLHQLCCWRISGDRKGVDPGWEKGHIQVCNSHQDPSFLTFNLPQFGPLCAAIILQTVLSASLPAPAWNPAATTLRQDLQQDCMWPQSAHQWHIFYDSCNSGIYDSRLRYTPYILYQSYRIEPEVSLGEVQLHSKNQKLTSWRKAPDTMDMKRKLQLNQEVLPQSFWDRVSQYAPLVDSIIPQSTNLF